MSVSVYLCKVIGESRERAVRFHPASQRRLTNFALAIHLPVLLWAGQGFAVAWGVFEAGVFAASLAAAGCGVVIYLLERLILGTPNSVAVAAFRLLIGLVVAMLGASAVDLLLFKREIGQQLRADGEARMAAVHAKRQQGLEREVERMRGEWLRAHAAASCEADGTCGSRVRNVGPVYRELARQAERLRDDYEQTRAQAQAQREADRAEMVAWMESSRPLDEAGLLQRLQALHDYLGGNAIAMGLWALVFVLVLAIELVVVHVKFACGETVDDHLERVREAVTRHRADAYLSAVKCPLAGARQVLEQPCD